METFLTVLRYVAGPLLGALIGFLTNWLAVKMLFRPYYPKKIGKFRLPFTPGIIPKRKDALANAVGKAVGEQLLTKDDVAAVIVSEQTKQKVAEYAVNMWRNAGNSTAQDLIGRVVSDEKQSEFQETAKDFITDRVYGAVNRLDLGGIVASEGVKVINQKKSSLGMLAMFLSDDLVKSLADKLSDGVNGYVEENGRQLISDAVDRELQSLINTPLSALTQNVSESVIANAACTVYEKAIGGIVTQLSESLDICAIVEEKINGMDVKELEKLVLSVMKKELNAIINLGALIGFILGVIMIFV